MSARGDQRGFTLLEALIALAIGAAALATLVGIVSSGLGASRLAGDLEAANRLAQSQLAIFLTGGPEPTSGTAGPFAWAITVLPLTGRAAAEGAEAMMLERVDATVSWRRGRAIRSTALGTLRIKVEATGAGN